VRKWHTCFYSRIDIEGNHHHCHAVRSGGSQRTFIEGPMLITFHCQEVRNGRSWPKQHSEISEEYHAEFQSSWKDKSNCGFATTIQPHCPSSSRSSVKGIVHLFIPSEKVLLACHGACLGEANTKRPEQAIIDHNRQTVCCLCKRCAKLFRMGLLQRRWSRAPAPSPESQSDKISSDALFPKCLLSYQAYLLGMGLYTYEVQNNDLDRSVNIEVLSLHVSSHKPESTITDRSKDQ
jgi:hypothetical protein